jgi:cytochrome b561
MIRDTSLSYGWVSIFFHWLSASATLFLFGLGVYLTSYGYYSPDYLEIAHLHYALGILLLFFITVRLLWRLSSKNPTSLSTKLPIKISTILVKLLLYIFLFAILISGYLICTAEGQSIAIFGLTEAPSLILLNTEQLNASGLTHKYIAWALIFLVLIHAGAALTHHFFVRDRTLARMIKPSNKQQ